MDSLIEITCTEYQQKLIISALITADFCTNGYPKYCKSCTCRSCLKDNIKWNIIDKEN